MRLGGWRQCSVKCAELSSDVGGGEELAVSVLKGKTSAETVARR